MKVAVARYGTLPATKFSAYIVERVILQKLKELGTLSRELESLKE